MALSERFSGGFGRGFGVALGLPLCFFLARYSRWAMASLVMDNGFPVRGLIGASVVVVSVVLVLSLIVVSGVSAMPPAYGVLGGLSVCVPPSPQGDMHACIHTYGHADMSVCRCVCV